MRLLKNSASHRLIKGNDFLYGHLGRNDGDSILIVPVVENLKCQIDVALCGRRLVSFAVDGSFEKVVNVQHGNKLSAPAINAHIGRSHA